MNEFLLGGLSPMGSGSGAQRSTSSADIRERPMAPSGQVPKLWPLPPHALGLPFPPPPPQHGVGGLLPPPPCTIVNLPYFIPVPIIVPVPVPYKPKINPEVNKSDKKFDDVTPVSNASHEEGERSYEEEITEAINLSKSCSLGEGAKGPDPESEGKTVLQGSTDDFNNQSRRKNSSRLPLVENAGINQR